MTGPLQILLVEDSALTAEQLQELIHISSEAADITTVASEDEALAELTKTSPDMVVLDLKLSKGTGFTVLQRIAAADPKPCVVVMTNYALPKYKELALACGADYFLDKAQDFKALPGIVDSVARKLLVTAIT